MDWISPSGRKIVLHDGDITRVPVDAMANAANAALAGGGGVDGAIHRAGGPTLMQELRAYHGCPTGSAVPTGAGKLPAKYVFHAVGPIYRDGLHGEAELLAGCYRKCLALADERGVRSLSFPAISTGVYGYPQHEAAAIAIREVREHLERADTSLREVVFVLYGKAAYDIYGALLAL
ncbi:MAG: O-acetyl-ADP-ribose deacetylase [Candidatus Solibacter sp.]